MYSPGTRLDSGSLMPTSANADEDTANSKTQINENSNLDNRIRPPSMVDAIGVFHRQTRLAGHAIN